MTPHCGSPMAHTWAGYLNLVDEFAIINMDYDCSIVTPPTVKLATKI